MENKTVVSGKPFTLSCKYILSKRVRQVLWKKTAEQGDTTTVASYVKNDRPIIETPFKDRISLNPSLGQTKLSIHQAQTEDEGCYTCEFHTYPDGIKSATACLSVYGKCKVVVVVMTELIGMFICFKIQGLVHPEMKVLVKVHRRLTLKKKKNIFIYFLP